MSERNKLIAQFRMYAQSNRLGQTKEDLGVWLIERMLFWDEEDYPMMPEDRVTLIARLRRTKRPEGSDDVVISARYQHMLDGYYADGEGLAYFAELWESKNTTVECQRLRRARQRLFLAVRECL